MDQADFVHLVRMSEHASADNSRAYRRSVAVFAALGYAWVLGCLALAVGILMWVVPQLLQGRFRFALVWALLGAGGLLWVSLRALWVRFDEPAGVEVTALDAPDLLRPTYELWTRRREGWLPEFAGMLQYKKNRVTS